MIFHDIPNVGTKVEREVIMRRREKGTGSITRTKQGRFKATIGISGNKRISRTFDSRDECLAFFNEVRGKDIKYFSPTTVKEYYEHFMEVKEGVYRGSTMNNIRHFYRKHLSSSKLASIRFSDLTPQDINAFFIGLASHGYATATLTHWRKDLKCILETAVYEGFLESNPMDDKRLLKKFRGGKPARPILTFTREEVKKLLERRNLSVIPEIYQVYIVISLITGARPQEVLALDPEDIEEDKIHFTKSLGFRGELQDTMKTTTSRRVVPIDPKYGRWLKNTVSPSPVFKSDKSTHGYLNIDNVNVQFKKYLKKILGSSKGHHLYDMRHTYATLLITEMGVDVKTVSVLMGHSNIETTLKYYTHATPTNSTVLSV